MKGIETMNDAKDNEKTPKKPEITEDLPVKVVTVTSQQKRMKRIIIIGAVVFVLLVGIGGTALYSVLSQLRSNNNPVTTQHQALVNDGNKVVTQEEQDIANVV